MDGYVHEFLSFGVEDCLHASRSDSSQDHILGVGKQGHAEPHSPARSSARVSGLVQTSTCHSSKPLSPPSSEISSYDARTESEASTTQSPNTFLDHNLLVPELESCHLCPYRGSAHGVAAHFKNSHHGRSSPCPLIPCARHGEPGCERSFKDERSRARHRQQSCKALPPQVFQCCCGRIVSKPHSSVRSASRSPTSPRQEPDRARLEPREPPSSGGISGCNKLPLEAESSKPKGASEYSMHIP